MDLIPTSAEQAASVAAKISQSLREQRSSGPIAPITFVKPATNALPKVDPLQGGRPHRRIDPYPNQVVSVEIDINDLKPICQGVLTRPNVLDEIGRGFGVTVQSRGKALNSKEKRQPDAQPLMIFVQGSEDAKVNQAITRIRHLIEANSPEGAAALAKISINREAHNIDRVMASAAAEPTSSGETSSKKSVDLQKSQPIKHPYSTPYPSQPNRIIAKPEPARPAVTSASGDPTARAYLDQALSLRASTKPEKKSPSPPARKGRSVSPPGADEVPVAPPTGYPTGPEMVTMPDGGRGIKVFIGLENAPPHFGLLARLLGPNELYLEHIRTETGARVSLKGFSFEPASSEPMHIFVCHENANQLEQAKLLAESLIQKTRSDFDEFVTSGQAGILPPALLQPNLPAVAPHVSTNPGYPMPMLPTSAPLQPAGYGSLAMPGQPASYMAPPPLVPGFVSDLAGSFNATDNEARGLKRHAYDPNVPVGVPPLQRPAMAGSNGSQPVDGLAVSETNEDDGFDPYRFRKDNRWPSELPSRQPGFQQFGPTIMPRNGPHQPHFAGVPPHPMQARLDGHHRADFYRRPLYPPDLQTARAAPVGVGGRARPPVVGPRPGFSRFGPRPPSQLQQFTENMKTALEPDFDYVPRMNVPPLLAQSKPAGSQLQSSMLTSVDKRPGEMSSDNGHGMTDTAAPSMVKAEDEASAETEMPANSNSSSMATGSSAGSMDTAKTAEPSPMQKLFQTSSRPTGITGLDKERLKNLPANSVSALLQINAQLMAVDGSGGGGGGGGSGGADENAATTSSEKKKKRRQKKSRCEPLNESPQQVGEASLEDVDETEATADQAASMDAIRTDLARQGGQAGDVDAADALSALGSAISDGSDLEL